LRARDLFDLHFLYQTRHSATATLSGLQKPAELSLYLPAARRHADLQPVFPVLNVKLKPIKIRQRELKVRGKAHPK
jgi:hypothetical protein